MDMPHEMRICIYKVYAEKLYQCFSFSLQTLFQLLVCIYGYANKASC